MNPHDVFHRFPKEFNLPFVLDGATGTALMKAGMPDGACPEKWIPENPGIIRTIQRSYYKAGSDAVLAPTFGGNRPQLLRHGLDDFAERNAALASLTRDLGCGYVGGDMSPTGLFLRPYGEASFGEITAIYAEQAKALEPYVDFYISETNISLAEARAAVKGIKSISDKPVFVTLTVDKNGRTISGDDMLCALLTLAETGAAAFGANCSVGPADMLKTLRPLIPYAAGLGVALIAKPNAGMPHDTPEGRVFDLDAEGFGKYILEFLDVGIYVLGGCCGSDESYIKHIRAAADSFKPDVVLPCADSSHIICSAKQAVRINPGSLPDPLPADENLFGFEGEFIFVKIENARDAEFLLESMAFLPCPLVLTGDFVECEKIIYQYCGKTIYKR